MCELWQANAESGVSGATLVNRPNPSCPDVADSDAAGGSMRSAIAGALRGLWLARFEDSDVSRAHESLS